MKNSVTKLYYSITVFANFKRFYIVSLNRLKIQLYFAPKYLGNFYQRNKYSVLNKTNQYSTKYLLTHIKWNVFKVKLHQRLIGKAKYFVLPEFWQDFCLHQQLHYWVRLTKPAKVRILSKFWQIKTFGLIFQTMIRLYLSLVRIQSIDHTSFSPHSQ